MDYGTILQILDSAVRLMTPLLLACLAGLYSERAGVFDIGLEGKMLMAAFAAAATAAAFMPAGPPPATRIRLGVVVGVSCPYCNSRPVSGRWMQEMAKPR